MQMAVALVERIFTAYSAPYAHVHSQRRYLSLSKRSARLRMAQGPPRPSPPRRCEDGCHGTVTDQAGDQEQRRAADPRPPHGPRLSPSALPGGSGEAPRRRLPHGYMGAGRGRVSGGKESAPAAGAAQEPPTAGPEGGQPLRPLASERGPAAAPQRPSPRGRSPVPVR